MSFEPVDLLVECRLGEAAEDQHGDGVKLTVRTSFEYASWSNEKTSVLHPWETLKRRPDARAHLGRLLFHDHGALQMLHDARDRASEDETWLRVVLQLDNPDDKRRDDAYDEDDDFDQAARVHREWLNSTPWEAMYVDLMGGKVCQPVALVFLDEPRVSIVRHVHQAHTQGFKLSGAISPRYLHVDATDAGTYPTAASLDTARFIAKDEKAKSLDAVAKLVKAHTPDLAVLHLTAHGTPRVGKVRGRLQLPDEDVDFGALADVIRPNSVGLLVLSVCSSARDKYTGMIGYLEQLAMPAFVGMQEPISVFANREFVDAFFTQLSVGGSLDEAMAAARERLLRRGSESGSPSWPIPVLYMSQETRKTPYLWAQDAPVLPAEFDSPDQVSLVGARRAADGDIRLLGRRSGGGFVWANEPIGAVSISPDGWLAAAAVGGTLWITTLGFEGEFWEWPAVNLASEKISAESTLLAVASEGPDRATCLLSCAEATVVIRVSTDGAIDQFRTLNDRRSYAGVLHAGRVLLVNGGVDEVHICDDFPQLHDVWAIDAVVSGGQLRVAAVGVDKAGDPVVHVNGSRVLTLRPDATAIGLVRESHRHATRSDLAVLSRGDSGHTLAVTPIPETDDWSTERWL